eukprot:Blabericola_migrator_1__5550@NODE_2828_length_2310_cov_27_133304_g310_i2_p1_GENE_NODE_2828_length_2310_cov_27_133304_g310_i2NODE_2828_length_2310_cov_27_133304_g310_i2_p1_ORF_typecomplete_len600_score66_74Kdo/PF06293_14/2_5e11Pkinase/PF00069_25/4_3e06Pkinase/PF00069_25/0_033APH/PF01636_23/1_2e06APH/PF01636_23/4_2e02Pkinase_Tyr/PF07714_17/0_044Pkinase_Tyr/PF07714_17/5_9Pkinase_Tyr/PF07714_17/2_4RIO1/PF01163_22/2_9e05_NODE_2828_length_2310_cov_27_133304_g310_i21591958
MFPSAKSLCLQSALDKPKANNITCLGNNVLRDISILGSGYSGEVKRVQDEAGQHYALKVSNEKMVRLVMSEVSGISSERVNLVLQEASEFEKLKKLYAAGVPVPRPFAFQIQVNADGRGTTAVLMELVKGMTLRDWLSEQPGGKTDRLSGRSVHPALTTADALARIDVSLAIISSLLKLRRLGFFADFKPRNIMIRETKFENEKHFAAYLVDIGGVVLYQDISLEANKPLDIPAETPVTLVFHPIRDRYLIETTCSYLSPEMALLISEYDFWKGRLTNHFFRTRKELRQTNENLPDELQETLSSLAWKNGRSLHLKADSKGPDLRVLSSYLETRRVSEKAGILVAADDYSPLSRHPLSQNDKVVISEKSSVFTLGLIMVELFGGRRTGLTSLTRLRHINDTFLGETSNAEFRMAMEWEMNNPFLEPSIPKPFTSRGLITSNTSTKCPTSSLSGTSKAESPQQSSISRSADSHRMNDDMFRMRSYFEIYRSNAYPSEGLLAATPQASVPQMDQSDSAIRRNDLREAVLTLLDACLRFHPDRRPSLAELATQLQDLRRDVLALQESPEVACTQEKAPSLWITSDTVVTPGRKLRPSLRALR